MPSAPKPDGGALELAPSQHDHVETVNLEPQDLQEKAEEATDPDVVEVMAPSPASGVPEIDPAADDAHFAPSDAPAVRSAVVARPAPEARPPSVPQPGPESPFQGDAAPGRPASRVSGRASARRRSATSAPAKAVSARSAPPSPSSRRLVMASRKTLMWIIAGVVLTGLALTAIVMFAGGESPERQKAGAALSEAMRQIALGRGAVANRQGAQARAAYEAAIRELEASPLFAEPAKAQPDIKVIPELASRAAGLRAEADSLLQAVRRVEADAAAEGNLASLKVRLSHLSDPATDIDRLERDLNAYGLNPVEPTAPADTVAAETYARLIGEVKLRQVDIVRERERRHAEAVIIPVNQARLRAEGLVRDERYGEALAMIEKAKTAFPKADFAPVVQMVNDDAAKGWGSAKAYVDTRITDARASGTTANQRQASLAAARERLNQVIDRFGLEPYVGQAKAMLAALP